MKLYVYTDKDSLDTARLQGKPVGDGILSAASEGIVVNLVAAIAQQRLIPQGLLIYWEEIGTAQALLREPDIADCGEVADTGEGLAGSPFMSFVQKEKKRVADLRSSVHRLSRVNRE